MHFLSSSRSLSHTLLLQKPTIIALNYLYFLRFKQRSEIKFQWIKIYRYISTTRDLSSRQRFDRSPLTSIDFRIKVDGNFTSSQFMCLFCCFTHKNKWIVRVTVHSPRDLCRNWRRSQVSTVYEAEQSRDPLPDAAGASQKVANRKLQCKGKIK